MRCMSKQGYRGSVAVVRREAVQHRIPTQFPTNIDLGNRPSKQ